MTTKGYIRYRSDYKYQLAEGYVISISIKPKSGADSVGAFFTGLKLPTTGGLYVALN